MSGILLAEAELKIEPRRLFEARISGAELRRSRRPDQRLEWIWSEVGLGVATESDSMPATRCVVTKTEQVNLLFIKA